MALGDVAEDDSQEALRRVRQSEMSSGVTAYRCETCGDAIPEDRRQNEPGTEHCADCIDALKHSTRRGFR
ncbi:TraR/DksA C4-type zinc finger protein [Pseudomonas fluorescens]|uniref:TraR/DksA C4-type zinc finger protein n=1 Tax=Pseudomonas fluorescens TaxID=294 RepID=A0A944DRS0_PSEFL|nr:TraR/DksA C4-type zinc finger protein [Pseudomonas fluorescens]MBT2306807.1 TraR/DksA C4-type zinc finger protein [Pseudomonas fluorescens]MBT2316283.1 TraR/DksA C4-type zinc finger protein [Pseudomonas fluorescens]MBT2331620.1 TraR/DksA C4-type zinc finger protein [Pseudomonas fluorescens]MBT2342788.1 TraR/DksA C4-type zinc finger protein [Pseudomonas fluorescens]